MDLSQLSTEDLIALKGGDLSKVSTDGLMKIKGQIGNNEPQGGNIERFAKGALEGVGQAGVGAMQAVTDLVSPKPFFGLPSPNQTLAKVVQPAKDLLTQTVDSSRGRVGQMGASGKVGELVGKIAGGAPLALAAGPEAEGYAALKPLQKVISSAYQGAVGGATQPVGTNDSRLDNTVAGAALGGAIPAAGIAKDVAKGAFTVGGRVLNGQDADALFSHIISKSDKSPQELLQSLESGNISNIADIGGDAVQGLTRSVAKTAGGKNIVSQNLDNRSLDAVRRVSNALSQDVSDVGTYFGNLDKLAKTRAAVAAPLYKNAFDSNPSIMSPDIESVLSTPAGKTALGQAASKMQNDMAAVGQRDPGLEAQAKAAGVAATDGVAKGLNLRTMDYVKRSLDDQISTSQRAGENDNVRILTGLKNKLTSSLDAADMTGDYAKARQVFGGFSKLSDAQEMGSEFDKYAPEQLSQMMKGLSSGEKDAFRIGVRQNLQDTVNKTPDAADPAKRIFGNTQKRAQLKQVFGSPQKFDQFSSKMQEEINAANTKFKIMGGSRTDYNLGANDSFGNIVDNIANQGIKQGIINTGLEKIVNVVKNRYLGITDENAKTVAQALTDRSTGISALKRIISTSPGSHDAEAAQEAINAVSKGGLPNPNAIRRLP